MNEKVQKARIKMWRGFLFKEGVEEREYAMYVRLFSKSLATAAMLASCSNGIASGLTFTAPVWGCCCPWPLLLFEFNIDCLKAAAESTCAVWSGRPAKFIAFCLSRSCFIGWLCRRFALRFVQWYFPLLSVVACNWRGSTMSCSCMPTHRCVGLLLHWVFTYKIA